MMANELMSQDEGQETARVYRLRVFSQQLELGAMEEGSSLRPPKKYTENYLSQPKKNIFQYVLASKTPAAHDPNVIVVATVESVLSTVIHITSGSANSTQASNMTSGLY
jgi:hypothetical protein